MNSRTTSTASRIVIAGRIVSIRLILLSIFSIVASGCGNFMYKQEVEIYGEIVEKKAIDCTVPYLLTRGCKDSKLANLNVDLHGLKFKAAFSDDGSHILVMHKMVTGGTTVLTNMVFEGVRTELSDKGLSVRAVTAVQTRYTEGADVIIGYFLEVDGDSYVVLKPYIVDQ